MDRFLRDMSALLQGYPDNATIKQKAIRRIVGEAIERECDDEEFEELMNVLNLDKNAKKFNVDLIRASIAETLSHEEEETEDSEPNYDIGGDDDNDDNDNEENGDGDDFLDHVQNQPGSDEQYTILDEGDDGDYGDGFLQTVENAHHLNQDSDRQRKLNELEESMDYTGEEGTEEEEAPSSIATYRSKNLSDSKNIQDETGVTNGAGEVGDEYTIDLGPLSEEDVITSPEVHGYADQVHTLEQSLEETSTELEELKIAHRRLLEAYR